MPVRSTTLQKRKSKSVGCFLLNYFSPGKEELLKRIEYSLHTIYFLVVNGTFPFRFVSISLLLQCRYVTYLLTLKTLN